MALTNTSVIQSPSEPAAAATPWTPAKSNLATIMAGLSPQDRWEMRDAERQNSANLERANRTFNTGWTTANNEHVQDTRTAFLNSGRSRLVGLSEAADSGLGWSPAVSGTAVALSEAQRLSAQAAADRARAEAQGALQTMLDSARVQYNEDTASTDMKAARLRDYAAMIKKMGTV